MIVHFWDTLSNLEKISLLMVCATTVAVIAAVVQPFLFHCLANRKTRIEERKEETAVLVALHQHFLVCCERIRDFWKDSLPEKKAPNFRLPTMAIERTFRLAAQRLRNNPELLREILRAFEKHTNLNETWNDLEAARADPPPREGSGLNAPSRYLWKIDSLSAYLKQATSDAYQVTSDCLSRIKHRVNEIAPQIELKEAEELPSFGAANADAVDAN